ncbi:MAG: FKBP-type peptidyl-prolyl cis-trans isomerase [Bacteroidales bacterium]|nr:FKBP-type peptidyl-prolyl cis-trans isomerase [Bacteroidales bacterium]
MKKFIIPAVLLFFASCGNKASQLATQIDTLSWAVGQNLALSLMQDNSLGLDRDVVMQAIGHTLDGKQQPLTDDEFQAAMQYVSQQAALAQMQQAAAMRQKVEKEQQDYFERLQAENPSVKRHSAGFYYEQLQAGSGPKAAFAQRVRFDYRGIKMLTGEVFDQTYGVRGPIVTVLGNPMFQGLQAGMQLMQAGSKYRFYFPYQLAFGAAGSSSVPPYTPLIYEVELHEIYKD